MPAEEFDVVWNGDWRRWCSDPPARPEITLVPSALPIHERSTAMRAIGWEVEQLILAQLDRGYKTKRDLFGGIHRSQNAIQNALKRLQKRRRITARWVEKRWIFFRLDRPMPTVVVPQRLPLEVA